MTWYARWPAGREWPILPSAWHFLQALRGLDDSAAGRTHTAEEVAEAIRCLEGIDGHIAADDPRAASEAIQLCRIA